MANPAFIYISLVLFVIWLLVFLFSQYTRKEQLILSVIGLVMTPAVLLMALTDFRNYTATEIGPIGIEDFIFGFSFVGIAGVVYQFLLGRRAVRMKKKKKKKKVTGNVHPLHWLARLISIVGIWALISFSLAFAFPINTVYCFVAGGLMVGIYIIADRHDLLFNALMSGFLFGGRRDTAAFDEAPSSSG